MRGTVSNGFRAPSLQQEYYSSSLTAWRANTLTGQLEQNVTRYVTVDDPAGQAPRDLDRDALIAHRCLTKQGGEVLGRVGKSHLQFAAVYR